MKETEPTPEEIREAEALARALEGDGSSPDLPENALQTACLLRSDDLDQERSQAVFEQVVAGTALEKQKQHPTRRWLIPVGGLATAAVVGILLAVPQASQPGPAALPDPEPALLQAQVKAASPKSQDLLALAEQMNRYRRNMYQALSERYPE